MGDCYSVELRIKLRKSTKGNLQKLMRQWMREKAVGRLVDGNVVPGVVWCLPDSRRHGIRPDSFAGICKILLAFHQGDGRVVQEDGFDVYYSGFNASRSWYWVMVEAFEKMAWALAEGSKLEIWYGGSDHDVYEIDSIKE